MDARAVSEDRENLSTPAEVAALLESLHNENILDGATCRKILDILALPKQSPLSRKLPPNLQVAGKPGSVDGVVNDVGVIYLPNRPFVFVAMISWAADRSEAEEAIAMASSLSYEYFERLKAANGYGHRR